jgi:hypothetical protein
LNHLVRTFPGQDQLYGNLGASEEDFENLQILRDRIRKKIYIWRKDPKTYKELLKQFNILPADKQKLIVGISLPPKELLEQKPDLADIPFTPTPTKNWPVSPPSSLPDTPLTLSAPFTPTLAFSSPTRVDEISTRFTELSVQKTGSQGIEMTSMNLSKPKGNLYSFIAKEHDCCIPPVPENTGE